MRLIWSIKSSPGLDCLWLFVGLVLLFNASPAAVANKICRMGA